MVEKASTTLSRDTMITSRERVLRALNFQPTDRLPKDLAGMASTSISAFAYPNLVKALGLPARRPRIHDTGQMLALPDRDVLDALECDVVTIYDGVITNAFDQPQVWHDFDFNGRLPAQVRNPQDFRIFPDGTLTQPASKSTMPPSSYVFDEDHGGQPVFLTGELPKYDLRKYRQEVQKRLITDEEIKKIAAVCQQARQSTDRAIFFNQGYLNPEISIHAHGGMAVFPILCLTEPDYVNELHEIVTEQTLKNIRLLLPEIRENVDIILMAADDWGTQKNTIASPKIFRSLFLPYRRRINDELHQLAPQVKSFLHTCGAVYDLIDMFVECHFDILNPVQWPAGGHSFQEWKSKADRRIALWGGGVNSQVTLPLGSIEDIEREVTSVASCLGQNSGYVFCNIHNLLQEIPPEKVIAMYRAAAAVQIPTA
jgi:uroporphyrinogen decarboxylase